MSVGLPWSGQLALSGQACLQLGMLKALLCHVAGRLLIIGKKFPAATEPCRACCLNLYPACIVLDGLRPRLGATCSCNVMDGKHPCKTPTISICQPARVLKMCWTQKRPQLRGPMEITPARLWQLLARLWAGAQAPSATGGAAARGPPAKDGPALLETAPAVLLSVSMMHQYWSGRPPPDLCRKSTNEFCAHFELYKVLDVVMYSEPSAKFQG